MKTMAGKFAMMLLVSTMAVNGVKQLMKVKRADICEESANSPFHLTDLRVEYNEGASDGVSGVMTTDHEIRELKIKILIIKCLNKEALDTCVPFTTLNPVNSCIFLHMQNTAWSTILDRIQPPLTCPLAKGEYILNNTHVDPNNFNLFPLVNYHWKVKYSFYDNNEYITFCIDTDVVKYYN